MERQENETLDSRVRQGVQCDFRGIAYDIVNQVRGILSRSMTGKMKKALDNLDKIEVDRIVKDVSSAFADKKMGLRELSSLARRELSIRVIKKATPKFRSDMMSGGVGPREYFDRFYKPNFIDFDVPANGISIIDPNLHAMLKKKGELGGISKSLENG